MPQNFAPSRDHQERLIKGETTLPTKLLSSSEDRLTDLVTRPADVTLLCPALWRAQKSLSYERPAEQGLRTAAPSGRTVEYACVHYTPAASVRVNPQIKINGMRMTQNYCHWSDPQEGYGHVLTAAVCWELATAAPRSSSLPYPNTIALRPLDCRQMHLILVTCPWPPEYHHADGLCADRDASHNGGLCWDS